MKRHNKMNKESQSHQGARYAPSLSNQDAHKKRLNLEEYVYLPSREHQGGLGHQHQSYADMFVSMDVDPLPYTNKEGYSHLAEQGAYMLRMRQFVDFLQVLQSGKALDGRGKRIPQSKLKEIYQTLLKGRNKGRYLHDEWINAQFKQASDASACVSLISEDFVRGSHIEIPYEYSLYPGMSTNTEIYHKRDISVHDWIARADWLGFPPKDVKKATFEGYLNYFPPNIGKQYRWLSCNEVMYLKCEEEYFLPKRNHDGTFRQTLTRAHVRPAYRVCDLQDTSRQRSSP